ncbi:MAG: diguanylate cyclase, partial [Candidatus Aegiribacteria sp.]|nr:diguanylate cyclase [Candidatus Aegiribacteria sp.]MBD3294586.1 diguanylate cyclase [Candidatus Fermentibacteria bacterium]
LSELHRRTGNYELALNHHREYHKLDREIFNARRIATMEEQLDLMHSELYTTNRKLEEANALLSKLSVTDELTGIYNRRKFEEFLSSEWKRCRRRSQPISLLMIDIDFFKDYNDEYGHTLGDDCLRAIAQGLDKEANRPTDLVARYGGEEFVIVLSETDGIGAMKVAKSARTDVEEMGIPHAASRAGDVVTVSVGVSTMIPSSDSDPEALIRRADKALYRSKKSGRNRLTSYEKTAAE